MEEQPQGVELTSPMQQAVFQRFIDSGRRYSASDGDDTIVSNDERSDAPIQIEHPREHSREQSAVSSVSSASTSMERDIRDAIAWRNRINFQASRLDLGTDNPTEHEKRLAVLRKKPFFYPGTRFLINPESPYVISWYLFMLFLIVKTIIFYPFALAFMNITSVLNILDIITCGFFFVDMCLTVNTAYLMRNGELITDRTEIVTRYLSTWFLVDLISTFPFSVVLPKSSGVLATLVFRFVKLLRTFRILRIFKIRKLNLVFQALLCGARFSTYTGRVVILAFFSWVIIHVSACLWFLIGTIYEDSAFSWVQRDFAGNSVVDMAIWEQYLISVYWAVMT
jgi:hypothetical protein